MKVTQVENGVPIFSWATDVDTKTYQQAINLATHPKVFKHVALMPDTHFGMGMPIGGVIACKDAVIPNACGVDIGCGMLFYRTNLDAEAVLPVLPEIIAQIEQNIPVGFKGHKLPKKNKLYKDLPETIDKVELEKSRYQLGTLGGGNHFIEIQKDTNNKVCIMIHSGSRHLGYSIANKYNRLAITLNKLWETNLPTNSLNGLNFLPTNTEEGRNYLIEMNFALNFAKENRDKMFKEVSIILSKAFPKVEFEDYTNIHHNYTSHENHFGKNVWVHRKGATLASKGTFGLIPGSMGTKSYRVRGLGNYKSFNSCSHGAGRLMGRKEFNRTHSVAECNATIENVVYSGWSKDRKGNVDLSESPMAYKDIDTVMANQIDLVEIVDTLTPLGVVKG